MKEPGGVVRKWFRITAPDGYQCLERASCAAEARMQASARPGYQPVEALVVEEQISEERIIGRGEYNGQNRDRTGR